MLRLTKTQIDNYRQIREISFKKLRSFTDYSLASGIEEIDLSCMKEGTHKNLLIDFFKSRQTFKKGNRITTRSIYRQTKTGNIIMYVLSNMFVNMVSAMHGAKI